MESRRAFSTIAGIGLVLVGLLAGILFMLFIDEEPAPQPIMRVVDRIELGSQQPPLHTADSDSGLSFEPPQPSALNRLFREVATRVTPAVVYIQVRAQTPKATEDGYHEFEGDMRDYFFRNPVPRQSVGSGVIIGPDGYVVTNYHVVEHASEIQVTLADKRQFEARVVGTDASTDLAVLKMDGEEDFPSIRLGNSDQIEVGDWVVAVGNPFRLTSTVTAGIVSALGRQVNIIEDDFSIEDFIQTDAAINPGNSGGALVNLRGELVGVNTAIATESGSYEGYGFAVPANLMERVTRDLIAFGEVRRGFLGVRIDEVDAQRAGQAGLGSVRGVYVVSAQRESAADAAGIRAGDIVLAIEGEDIDAPNELQSAVARQRPGDVIMVDLWRDGRVESVQVRLMGRNAPAYQDWLSELRPNEEPPEGSDSERVPTPSGERLFELETWGTGLRTVEQRERNAFDVDSGVYVAYVEKEGAAARSGLPRDIVITHVEGTPVETPEDVRRAIETAASDTVLVRVQRRDGTIAFYEVG